MTAVILIPAALTRMTKQMMSGSKQLVLIKCCCLASAFAMGMALAPWTRFLFGLSRVPRDFFGAMTVRIEPNLWHCVASSIFIDVFQAIKRALLSLYPAP